MSPRLRRPSRQRRPIQGYLLPPKVIVDILDQPRPPEVFLSPSRDVVAVLEHAPMPTIAELSRPMLRLAGLRIDPATNGRHRARAARALVLKAVADGATRTVTLPPSPALTWLGFSADGARFAFTQTRPTGIELWVGETATGRASALPGADLNAVLATPCAWVGTGTSLLCATTVPGRGAAPTLPSVPTGPNVQEHRGGVSPVRTYQDLLTSAHDEALFEYYATSQLVTVNATTGARTPLGRPGLHTQVLPSPDGQYTAVTRLSKPYSRLVPYADFAKSVEVWDRVGAITRTIATLPVADDVPNGGVLPGPRSFRWHPLEPATLAWVEALDGGNPKTQVPQRDRISTLAAPFKGEPAELARTEYRFSGLSLDGCRRGALLGVRSHAALDPHVGARQTRRRPAQAVGSERRGSLRRSGHGAAPHARLGHRVDRAERRHDLPGRPRAPRRKATSHSSTR